ncbi:methyltransferase [Streptomyces sp. NPDC003077]|uniref:methyltransferase n=1 Tax=Streptomyces sp. NPDC003077 TaxID=3154443 RepID=UPI0033A29B15
MTAADPATRALMVRMTYGYMTSQMIHTAVELRIPELLRAGPRRSDELAALTDTHPPSLYRLLRSLATFGVLLETDPGRFALAPAGTPLDPCAEGGIDAITRLFCGEQVWRSWGRLAYSIRTGRAAFEAVHDRDFYAYVSEDSDFARTFRDAMAENASFEAPFIVAAHDFGQYRTIVDVGGGDGTLLSAVLAEHEKVRGIVLETPAMADVARERIARAGLAERCEVVAGDFFDAVPDEGDAYLIKSVLHNWDDERCVALLRSCRAAMGPQDRLLVLEPVLPATARAATCVETAFSDLNMLVLTAGGFERTEEQFRTVFAAAGFELAGIGEPIEATDFRVVQARPAGTGS